ncbi:MAG: hypothetical protein HQM12_09725 [SAR324 cluster bacterium]|nr:hypothetical protein [SAR324 cluster bacterium]
MKHIPIRDQTYDMVNDHLTALLERVIPALDLLHGLPFSSRWTEQPLTLQARGCFQELESVLLRLWSVLRSSGLEFLEPELVTWHHAQKRDPKGLIQRYYRWQEDLCRWTSQPEQQSLKLKPVWQDYVLYSLFFSGKTWHETGLYNDHVTPEIELVLRHHLEQTELLFKTDLYQLYTEILQFIAIFIEESIFLPCVAINPAPVEAPLTSPWLHFFNILRTHDTWADKIQAYLQVLGSTDSSNEAYV